MIKESVDLIAEYLLEIFWASFALNSYSDRWWVWDTIVLHKLGKLRYDIPKAHRPIALMNTLRKLFSAIVAEDLTHMCDFYGLLLDTGQVDVRLMQCISRHTGSRRHGAGAMWQPSFFWTLRVLFPTLSHLVCSTICACARFLKSMSFS